MVVQYCLWEGVIMKNIVKILILGMLFAPLLIVFPVSGQELAVLADTPWPMYQHDRTAHRAQPIDGHHAPTGVVMGGIAG